MRPGERRREPVTRSARAWRAVVVVAASISLAALVSCSRAAAPLEAPSWSHPAITADRADVVGLMNLDGAREDPVFGPLIEKLARRDDLAVLLRASQIDIVADVDHGKTTTWVAVVHGIDGPPGARDLGRQRAVVIVPGAWILGEGAAFERARTSPPAHPERISVSGRTLFASTVRGRAVPSSRHGELAQSADELRQATVEVRGGSHLELVGSFLFVDADAAKRAAVMAKILLAAAAARGDLAAQIARALVKVDFDVSGDSVTVRMVIDDDLRDVLRQYVERMDR